MTVIRIATLGRLIPVTVGTFETRRRHEGLKATTVTGMAVLRRENDDNYEDRDRQEPHPCDCWHS